MNTSRRSFFKTLAAAAAGFTILPAATTYDRIWRVERPKVWVPNPEWEAAPYQMGWIVQPPGWTVEEYNNMEKARFKRENGQFIMVKRFILA